MEDNNTSQGKVQPVGNQGNTNNFILKVHSSDQILTTEFPEPVWAVPGILPVGLTLLAGAPKVGKSWLALQFAQAVASGGEVFGQHVEKGAVLYMALEDSGRRLQERMRKQNWTLGLRADFLILGEYKNQIGDIRTGGGQRLAHAIQTKEYRFVVIDTLSRAIPGEQDDVAVMTAALAPSKRLPLRAIHQLC